MRRWWRKCAGRSGREELFPFGVGRAGDESAGGGGPVGGRRVAWGVSNEFDRGACGWRSAGVPNEFGLPGPSANGRPAPTEKNPLRWRRPTPGAQRLRRPISIGVKAFGRRSACAPNEFGLQGPSANGRPAPTGRCLLRRRRPTPGAQRLGRPISNRRESLRRPGGCLLRRRRPTPGAERPGRPISIGMKASGRRSACADREGVFCVGEGRRPARSALEGRFPIGVKACADREVPFASAKADARRGAPWKADFNRHEGLRPAVGMRRPGGCLLRRRRPTPGAQRPGRLISIGVKAFGRRSACVPNEFSLQGPSANGRPTPTGRVSFASAKANARRESA
jgi:hypothetical protein